MKYYILKNEIPVAVENSVGEITDDMTKLVNAGDKTDEFTLAFKVCDGYVRLRKERGKNDPTGV